MNSPSTQFPSSRRMGIYEPAHLISMWGESFKGGASPNTGVSTIVGVETKLDDKSEESQDTSHGSLGPSKNYDREARKLSDKVIRRLAQNREAARKSRLRKKAYVQQLESSRLKLTQLEQELERTRQQGVYISGAYDTNHLGLPETVNSDGGMNHYYDLFRMKAAAAKADVFYIMSGMWKTSAERFFLWIGGFRPSELLKVLIQQLDPLTEQQLMEVCNLQQSSQQAEDALSQGMDKLQMTLAETIAADPLVVGSYTLQMTTAMEKLEAIVSFVNQADHIRQQTLQQMARILTTRQAARGLVALGEFFHSLRALSSLWAACPREPA
ncbi:transcription factor TGA1-like isoform X2 [Macadamia integrifolia]|uniref:transcription factor TGA1-like isoform X2 n=1 Tax=Macadamia integrifolia TaxID=60698 RepID=UPI001C4EADDF|nr:transcription factor TGA1-like isoform X2 [Macadamia integrifolia]